MTNLNLTQSDGDTGGDSGSWRQWALGVLVMLVAGLGTLVANAHDKRLERMENRQDTEIPGPIRERLATVETTVAVQGEATREQLRRIEQKVDRLIEHERGDR